MEANTAPSRRAFLSFHHLRHTFASRLSVGGVSDHFVTQMLRQGDADVFKRYSHAKLNIMREALVRLDRHANEHPASFVTSGAKLRVFNYGLVRSLFREELLP